MEKLKFLNVCVSVGAPDGTAAAANHLSCSQKEDHSMDTGLCETHLCYPVLSCCDTKLSKVLFLAHSFRVFTPWLRGPMDLRWSYVKVGSMWQRKLAYLQTSRKQTAEKVPRTTYILPGYPVAPSSNYNPPPSFHRPRTMLSKHKPIHG